MNVVNKKKSYSNLAIADTLKREPLRGADRAFFTALVYGTTERKLTLDYELSLYLKQPLKKLHPKVYTALLLGSFQILFMDRVPAPAAINESVKLVQANGAGFAGGLVNAVLRRVSEHGLVLPDETDTVRYKSVLWSCPEYLVRLWTESYGEENADGIMKASLGAPPLVVRVNTTRTTAQDLTETLAKEGVQAVPHKLADNALVLSGSPNLEALPSFRNGLFHVQDAASQVCCARVAPQPGETVFDLCAAPGGKSFTLAEIMNNTGTVRSFDLYEQRTELIRKGAEKLGLTCIEPAVNDAEKADTSLGKADRVLCDVPCSGLGVIGRKPEIRYKTAASIDNLPPLQYLILCNSIQYLKPNGTLVYSTCSLNPAENDDVCKKFLACHEEFTQVSRETLMPHKDDCDGFFISVFKKTC